MKNLKVIVAHPDKQHSYKLAAALKEHEILFKYITTVYNKENSWLMKLVKIVLSGDNLKKAKNKKSNNLNDDEVIQFCELSGFLSLILKRIDKSKKIYKWWTRKRFDHFGKKVADYAIKNNVDAVIMYDTTAKKCFQILKRKAPEIIRIMDSSSANKFYTKYILQKEIEKSKNTSFYQNNRYLWDDKFMKNYCEEVNLTDHFLVPSNFVKKSFLFSDISENKINIVPYGANFILDNKDFNQKENSNQNLKFLFVGQVLNRKGVGYLLKAFNELNNNSIELHIAGKGYKEFLKNNPYVLSENIYFHGFITHDKIKKTYINSDVFVFPSFTEGMTLAGLEAMGSGLPIICTHNSGVNDLVINGKNGFVIPVGDFRSIKNKIQWFINNKNLIPEMGINAKQTAEKYTWDNYKNNVVKVINSILKN